MAAIGYIAMDMFKEDKNLMTLPGVFAGKQVSEATKAHEVLWDVLSLLVRTNKNWRFIATMERRQLVLGFEIFHSKELLGSVSISRKADRWRIFVNNDRINNDRVRGEGYWTSDPEKATLKIRKEFYRVSLNSRFMAATTQANVVVKSRDSEAKDTKNFHELAIASQVWQFLRNNFDEFVASLSDVAKQGSAHAYMEAVEVKRGIAAFKYKWNNATTGKEVMLVIEDEGQYIVKFGDDVTFHTNETMTDDMKSKLGMLKLVEVGQLFPDIGCRVSLDTFLITCAT